MIDSTFNPITTVVLGMLDEIDMQLLEALAGDGRATTTSLAARVGLSGPSVGDRLRKLEAAGVLRGYTALLDPVAVQAGTAAYVALNLGPGALDKARIDAALAAEPAVLEAHEIAGEDCYLLKLRVESPQALSAALTRLRRVHPHAATRTTVVLRTVFERPLLAGRAPARPPSARVRGA
ncbi:MAG TPA: Lrp/AsnC family transcriptional regulator [Actinomycetes bacterium]|nr:Lrp/AsnC family transcriptional regulator [Actinomycetes bacterium]